MAIGVAVVASIAVVRVAGDPVMVVVHRILVVVFMAIDATEHAVVRGVRVAFCTGIPFVIVCSAVDREVLPIMVECRRLPAIGRMAILA